MLDGRESDCRPRRNLYRTEGTGGPYIHVETRTYRKLLSWNTTLFSTLVSGCYLRRQSRLVMSLKGTTRGGRRRHSWSSVFVLKVSVNKRVRVTFNTLSAERTGEPHRKLPDSSLRFGPGVGSRRSRPHVYPDWDSSVTPSCHCLGLTRVRPLRSSVETWSWSTFWRKCIFFRKMDKGIDFDVRRVRSYSDRRLKRTWFRT